MYGFFSEIDICVLVGDIKREDNNQRGKNASERDCRAS